MGWALLCAGGEGGTAPVMSIPDWIPSSQSNWGCRIRVKTGSDITTDRMICGNETNTTVGAGRCFKFAVTGGAFVCLYGSYWNGTDWLRYIVTANTEYDLLYKVTATAFELWDNTTNTLLITKPLLNRLSAGAAIGRSVVGRNVLNSVTQQSPAGFLYYNVDYIDYTTPSNTRNYDANLSGGTGNAILTVQGTNSSTQIGTWPADNSEWVFYSSGTAYTATINKGTLSTSNKQLTLSNGANLAVNKSTLTLANKQLSTRLGLSLTSGKSNLLIQSKQLSNSLGLSLGVSKGSLTLTSKQESVNAGYINVLSKLGISLQLKQLAVVSGTAIPFTGTLNKSNVSLNNKLLSLSISSLSTISKRTLPLSTKPLTLTSGTSIPFTGTLNKSSLSINTKQLSVVGGFNSNVGKQSIFVSGKQENVLAGYVSGVSLAHLAIQYKLLSLTTGTSIPFIGNMSKSNLNAVGKPLSLVAETVIPFVGVMNKTSLTLSGKQLSTIRGQLLDLNVRHLILTGKSLSIGEIIYPVIASRRVFNMNLKPTIFIMRR